MIPDPLTAQGNRFSAGALATIDRLPSAISPNPEQRAVIEADFDVPQKVIAGAGTGKTMTMVWRFAHLVETQGFDPKRLMAVTFTTKAAAELRFRITNELVRRGLVASTLDLDGAWIGTFHALAFRVLQEHCYQIGFDRETTIIDELETALLIKDVQRSLRDGELEDAAILELEAISPDRAMKLSHEMFSLITAVRGLGLSSEVLCRHIHESIDCVREIPPPSLKDQWETERKAHREVERLFNATYAEYGRRLGQRRLLDFDGVLITARDALRNNGAFQAQMRRQLQYIIVDEFQDTNRVQLEFLGALARPDAGNLQVVGDPRQSIYGWRDADIQNILEFPRNLLTNRVSDPSERSFTLKENRRSDQAILDAAAEILRRDEDLYAAARLEATPQRQSAEAFQLYLAASPDQEASYIASKLIELHESGRRWSDMAILTRAANPPVAFETELRTAGIPYVSGRGQGFFDRQEIKDVLSFLRVINDPLDDASLIRLLQGPVVRVSDSEMYCLRSRVEPGSRQTTWDVLTDSEEEGFLEFCDAARSRVSEALGLVRDGMAQKGRLALGELLQIVLDRSHYVTHAAASPAEGQRRTANIRKLTRMAADFEARQVFSGLGDFIQYVELHDAMDVRTAEADVAGVDAVNFMTIHAAKGLEFPVVFLAHLRPYRSLERRALFYDDSYGLVLKYLDESDTKLASHKYNDWCMYGKTPSALAKQESRRVIYVALTRAKDTLIVTATRRNQPDWASVIAASEKGVDCNFDFFRQLTLFVDTNPTRGILLPPSDLRSVRPLQAERPLGALSKEPALPQAPTTSSSAAITAKPLQLSPSAFATFVECPLRYQYLYEWRLPLLPDGMSPFGDDVEALEKDRDIPADIFGTLVHELLQWFHETSATASLEQLQAQWEILSEGRIAPSQVVAAWDGRVSEMMERYSSLDVAEYETLAVEQRFRLIREVDGREVVIDGRIDRVCRATNDDVLLLDYKTTKTIDASTLEAYRRQLAIYQLASETVFKWKAKAFVVDLPRGGLIPSGTAEPEHEVVSYIREILAEGRKAPAKPPCYVCGYRLSCPSSTVPRKATS